MNLGTGVNEIQSWAFVNDGITELSVPKSTTIIGNYGFYKNKIAKLIIAGAENTTIGLNAFSGNPVATFDYTNGVPNITDDATTSKFNYDFDVTTKTAVLKGIKSGQTIDANLVIPSSVVKDGVTYSVTGIGSFAFWRNTTLSSVAIPNSVKMIDGFAFSEIPTLTSVNLGNGVIEIGWSAFAKGGLTEVNIPKSVTKIGDAAFPSQHKDLGYTTLA